MNKKSFVLIGFLLFANAFSLAAITLQTENITQEERQKWLEKKRWEETQILKTYQLKHIKPEVLIDATRFYIIDATVYKNTVTVKIRNKNVLAFEELLKKIDVEQKDVIFKIYLIEAHRKEIKAFVPIQDPELKEALQELGELWKFKSYNVDGPSFITVKESSGPEVFRLLSRYNMNMEITNVQIQDEEDGKRTISVEIMKLWGTRNFVESKFLETYNKKLKENGLLVAGISGFSSDRAIILVISAEVKEKTEKEVFQSHLLWVR